MKGVNFEEIFALWNTCTALSINQNLSHFCNNLIHHNGSYGSNDFICFWVTILRRSILLVVHHVILCIPAFSIELYTKILKQKFITALKFFIKNYARWYLITLIPASRNSSGINQNQSDQGFIKCSHDS